MFGGAGIASVALGDELCCIWFCWFWLVVFVSLFWVSWCLGSHFGNICCACCVVLICFDAGWLLLFVICCLILGCGFRSMVCVFRCALVLVWVLLFLPDAVCFGIVICVYVSGELLWVGLVLNAVWFVC